MTPTDQCLQFIYNKQSVGGVIVKKFVNRSALVLGMFIIGSCGDNTYVSMNMDWVFEGPGGIPIVVRNLGYEWLLTHHCFNDDDCHTGFRSADSGGNGYADKRYMCREVLNSMELYGLPMNACMPGCRVLETSPPDMYGNVVPTKDTCGDGPKGENEYVCVATDASGTWGDCVATDDAVCPTQTCPVVPDCGDGKCSGGEDTASCPSDCKPVPVTYVTCTYTCPAPADMVRVWDGLPADQYRGVVLENGASRTTTVSALCSWQWPHLLFNCTKSTSNNDPTTWDHLGTAQAQVSCTPSPTQVKVMPNGQSEVDFDWVQCN